MRLSLFNNIKTPDAIASGVVAFGFRLFAHFNICRSVVTEDYV